MIINGICCNCIWKVLKDYAIVGCIMKNDQTFESGECISAEYNCPDFYSIKDYNADNVYSDAVYTEDI